MLLLQQQSKRINLRLLREHTDISACKANVRSGGVGEVKGAVLDVACDRVGGGKAPRIDVSHLVLTEVPTLSTESREAKMR